MNSRNLVIRTLEHKPVDRVPRDLWYLPGIPMFRKGELDRMLDMYPPDIAVPDFSYTRTGRESGTPNVVGNYTDAWGCVWHVGEDGVVGEVKGHPLVDWSSLSTYRPPYERLSGVDLDEVNRFCAETDRFVVSPCAANPFERLQFLRGPESVYTDLACGSRELRALMDMLHDYYTTELRMWAKTDVDAGMFMDDWGAQSSLLISPDMWRAIFKPLYSDYCRILHEKGKWVFFHSDGYITPIIEDLIEIGVDALNSQLFCMDIEDIGDRFRGRITFWGEIDRQKVLPFGAVDEVRSAVRRVRKALDRGRGGVIAQCEWGLGVPFENVAAVFDEWSKPLETDTG